MSKNIRLSDSAIRQHTQLRRKWGGLLLYLGIDVNKAKADDVLTVLEDRQFAADVIAEVLRLFFPGPDTDPPRGGTFKPQTSITREARVEILRQRVQGKLPPCHPQDIVRGMLDDHVDHAPEGKPLVSWYDVEIMAELEEELENLDYLDEVPRERARRWQDERGQAIDSLLGLALAI